MKIYDKKLAYPYFVWMTLFTVVPLLIVVYYAFTDGNGAFTRALGLDVELAGAGLGVRARRGLITFKDGKAALKAVYRMPVSQLVPAPLGGELPVVSKELVRDLLPDLKSGNGYVVDKVESLAIDGEGTAYVITDNDGVDDSSGETLLWTFKVE